MKEKVALPFYTKRCSVIATKAHDNHLVRPNCAAFRILFWRLENLPSLVIDTLWSGGGIMCRERTQRLTASARVQGAWRGKPRLVGSENRG